MLVSNTSTIVLLAKIRCLETFIEMAPIIEVPTQVKREALFYDSEYYAMLIDKFIQDSKIIVKSVDENKVKEIISEFRLDEGEAATYVLFDKKKHKAILTDDGELIKLCKLRNIPFICAMAVILRLYEKKKLSKDAAFDKLKKLSEIGRYSKDIYEHFRGEIK